MAGISPATPEPNPNIHIARTHTQLYLQVNMEEEDFSQLSLEDKLVHKVEDNFGIQFLIFSFW